VDVLGRFDLFREPRQRVARLGIARVVHFEQDRVVALHDERVLRDVFGRAGHGREGMGDNTPTAVVTAHPVNRSRKADGRRTSLPNGLPRSRRSLS
jgi:hypothetical protein